MLYTTSQVFLDQPRLGLLYSYEMTIGARLRQLRISWGLTQDKLGELCDVSKGMVSQWELNIVTPPTDRLIELRKHHNFSYDWLLNGETVYSTTDPKIIAVAKVMEPAAEYEKDNYVQVVLTNAELAKRAKANGTNG